MSGNVLQCETCGGLVKPDIVFFGESLPRRFFALLSDFTACDLLIIMGTSLIVNPFASLVLRVEPRVPRLLINLEKVGENELMAGVPGYSGLNFGETNTRDALYLGDCDEGVLELCRRLGWDEDLRALAKRAGNPVGAATKVENGAVGVANSVEGGGGGSASATPAVNGKSEKENEIGNRAVEESAKEEVKMGRGLEGNGDVSAGGSIAAETSC